MSQQELIAFDASHQAYIPIIEEAAQMANWRILPYDDEAATIEDITDYPKPVMVTVLNDYSFAWGNYAGRNLLELATELNIRHAVIALENMQDRLSIVSPNLFIPKTPGMIVGALSSWLIELSK